MRRAWFCLCCLAIFLGGIVTACANEDAETQEADRLSLSVTEVTTAEFDPVIDDREPFWAPDFTLQSLEGTSYILSDLQGQWVIINFWATWCEPCISEIPALQAIADLYAGRLVVLGINMREPAEAVRLFRESYAVGYPLLLNPDDATVLNYQVVGLPQTLVVDPAGEIVWRQFGPMELDIFQHDLEALIQIFPSN